MASNSADGDDRPTGDAINTLNVSIPVDSTFDVSTPVELTERLYFAQFANGTGVISQVTLLNVGVGKEVNAKLELRDGNGAPLNVVLNGEMISGETEIFSIAAGGGAVFASDGIGPVVAGSLTVHADGPLRGVVLFEGLALGVAVMNPDAEEKRLQVRLIGLDGTEVGTGTATADPLAGNGHLAKFIDEFEWDDPVPDLKDFQGVPEVVPSHGRVAATVLRISFGTNMASLPVAPIE